MEKLHETFTENILMDAALKKKWEYSKAQAKSLPKNHEDRIKFAKRVLGIRNLKCIYRKMDELK